MNTPPDQQDPRRRQVPIGDPTAPQNVPPSPDAPPPEEAPEGDPPEPPVPRDNAHR
jgi:hypothetical protein